MYHAARPNNSNPDIFEEGKRVCHQILSTIMIEDQMAGFRINLDVVRGRLGEFVEEGIRLAAAYFASTEG